MIASSSGIIKSGRIAFLIGKFLLKSWFVPAGGKRIFMEINNLYPNRYLYTFVKFFILCGYTVFIPFDLQFLKKLGINKGESLFSSWILKEEIKIGKPKGEFISIQADRLSNDYFSRGNGNGSYHVPMSEFPVFYSQSIDLPPKKSIEQRKNSIFMAGNLDARYYDKNSYSAFFPIPSRYRTVQYLKSISELYQYIGTNRELEEFIFSKLDRRIIIIDTVKDFRIPIEKLKGVLVNFRFYLALPGVSMPQCHNVVEAMSVGCIPLIHEHYAITFSPPLRHGETALTYKDLEDLSNLTSIALNLPAHQLKEMSNNVLLYYSRFLSPESVVEAIIEQRPKKIFIQAEFVSLSLLQIE